VRLDLAECSDGELAALALAGRQTAYAEMMRRHRETIYRLTRGYAGDPDAALDLVQETFIAAFGALDRYDQERSFRPWLSRIAINKCRDWARRRAVRELLSGFAGAAELDAVPDLAPAIDQAAADRQMLDLLLKKIAALPRQLREPLVLRTIEGLTQAETAEILKISEKAVETRLYRARSKLASLRQNAGG
jgi:RNA polymerase sigma factor (sigma-70 family)